MRFPNHRVDIRIIAATNRSLADLVQRRLFRLDLFYRLSGVDVRVPTLRERLMESGANGWLWVHISQAAVFSVLAW